MLHVEIFFARPDEERSIDSGFLDRRAFAVPNEVLKEMDDEEETLLKAAGFRTTENIFLFFIFILYFYWRSN